MVTAYVGVDAIRVVGPDGQVARRRVAFGERNVDYRDYLGALSDRPQTVRQLADVLIAVLGEPFDRAWRLLDDEHGPNQAARHFARILGSVQSQGLEDTSAWLDVAFRAGESILTVLWMPPRTVPEMDVERVLLSLRNFHVKVPHPEADSHQATAVRDRICDAHFPEEKSLEAFDSDATVGFDRTLIDHLARCEWLRKRHNVLVARTIGTGKSLLAIALGNEAARQRHHDGFWRIADLVQQLVEAKDQRELGRSKKRLARLDLLIVDELGFVPFDRTGGELLFNVLVERNERRSVLTTTNLAPAGRPRVFGGDGNLAAAALDRLAHHSIVLTTSRPNYRLRVRAKANANV